MPFDALDQSVIDKPTSLLERVGLIPVPADVLGDHKKQVETAFRSRTDLTFSQRTEARWFEFYQDNSKFFPKCLYSCAQVVDPLTNVLLYTRQGRGLGDTIPRAVSDIVERTEQRFREQGIETERVVGFFYTDPYVCLMYRHAGFDKKVCLAIWDGNTVLHIAHLR